MKKLLSFIALTIATVFMSLLLFVRPDFLEPVSSAIDNFGRFSIGPVTFSLGGTLAIILYFGILMDAWRRLEK